MTWNVHVRAFDRLGTYWCPFRIYLALFLIGIGTVSLICLKADGVIYPFSNDSVGYIEEAGALIDGKGLTRPGPWDQPKIEAEPSRLFPPGYSVLIGLVSYVTGSEPSDIALAFSRGAWMVMPAAMYFALQWILGPIPSLSAALLVLLSPSLYHWSYNALSDGPFLLCVVLALGILSHAIKDNRSARLILISGLLSGVAYAIRNAGIAIPASVLSALALSVLLKLVKPSDFLRIGLFWSAGFLVVTVPLMTRNILLFGSPQPYYGGASEYGPIAAIRIFIWSIIADGTSSRWLADNLAWNGTLLTFICFPLAILAFLRATVKWRGLTSERKVGMLLIATYLGLASAVIVVGRIKYDWVETDLIRHVMQCNWLIVVFLLFAISENVSDSSLYTAKSRIVNSLVAALVLILGAGRIAYIDADIRREKAIAEAIGKVPLLEAVSLDDHPDWVITNQLKLRYARDPSVKEYFGRLDGRSYLVSNFAPILAISHDKPARQISLNSDTAAEMLRVFSTMAKDLSVARPAYLILFPTNSLLRKREWPGGIISLLPHELEIKAKVGDGLVIGLADAAE